MENIPHFCTGRINIVKVTIKPKAILRGKSRRHNPSRFQKILQSYSNQNSVVLAQKQGPRL